MRIEAHPIKSITPDTLNVPGVKKANESMRGLAVVGDVLLGVHVQLLNRWVYAVFCTPNLSCIDYVECEIGDLTLDLFCNYTRGLSERRGGEHGDGSGKD